MGSEQNSPAKTIHIGCYCVQVNKGKIISYTKRTLKAIDTGPMKEKYNEKLNMTSSFKRWHPLRKHMPKYYRQYLGTPQKGLIETHSNP
jgi:hypothetical protein